MFGNNAGGFGGAELGDLGGDGGYDFAGGAAGKTNLHFLNSYLYFLIYILLTQKTFFEK